MTTLSIARQEQRQKIDDFIENSRKKLTSIVSRLGWSVESISKDVKNIVVCPFNNGHRIPDEFLDQHLQDCQWKAEGYRKHDLPLSIPSLPPGAPSSIKFDEQLQDDVIQSAKQQNPTMKLGAGGRLIPRTSDRLITDFTRDERCAMYEYVIANTVEPDMGDDIADMNKPKSSADGKTSSYLELLAQERNLKRRRAKYRGVHTNKKSQVEILREVVNQQMEMLAEYISEKRDNTSDCQTNGFSSADASRSQDYDGNSHERHFGASGSDHIATGSSFSTSNNDRRWRDHSSKRLGQRNARERSSDDRKYNRPRSDSRDSQWNKEPSTETRMFSRKVPCADEREQRETSERSRDKSGHKRHRHKSKDRHRRTRSRERVKSRSSRDDPRYDEKQRSESSRHSQCDNRRTKKRKSRSR